ncbi:MAG TPA: hypothetical protein VK988_01945, partial [Acidimicrobiales bacterium]|nr:hypothetical protein [Acidimicrobiales bacterium]
MPRADQKIPQRPMALALLAVAVLAAACSGSSESPSASAPAVRASGPPVMASPTTAPPAGDSRRSQPYWTPVVTLKGSGDTTTETFAVVPNALQWRAFFRCEKGPFTALPLKDSGQPLKRPLADGAGCEQEGKGFAVETGRFTLKITTPGTWEVRIEQQIDTPLVEPPAPGLEGAQVLGKTTFYGVDRQGEGTATLFKMPDGSQLIRLESFFVTLNSDLEIRMSPLPAPKTTDEIARAGFTNVAPLKATVGSM